MTGTLLRIALLAAFTVGALLGAADAPTKAQKSVFHVKYVGHDSIYIDGGTADGLLEGMTLDLRRRPPGSAEVDAAPVGAAIIRALATTSAVCEMQSSTLPPAQGDEARLSNAGEIVRLRSEVSKGNRKYLQIVEFSGVDPLDEEQRAYVPRPHVNELARMRGSIAFEHSQITDHDSASSSSQDGAAVRVDWTHINGTNWNLIGYWRGSMSRNTSSQASTLLDLLNRTYQIGLFYSNPAGLWALGAGRLFVPGATSVGVIDGVYVTRKLNSTVSAGVFAGASPDPTQWNFTPNRQTAGTYLKFEKGSFDTRRWTGTVGIALTRVNWRPERQYLFAENSYSLNRMFSLFQTLQLDWRNSKLMNGATGAQLSQSFTTARFQPNQKIAFDLNHNYLRGVPTFDQRLLGTGLLDQYLFTGLSGSVRVEPTPQLLLMGSWGESRRNGETSHALNQYYGAGWKRLPWIGVRLDARYSRFHSSFGDGSYESLSASREIFDTLRVQFEGGVQDVHSALTSQRKAHYFNTTGDWQFSQHYFLTGGWLYYCGQSQNYDQIYASLGYRFR